MFLTLVSFFLILIILILVHELGHFFTAKLFKVKVEEFGIFMPPRLFSFKRGETVYSLNAVPLGGFCKMAGEEDPEVDRSLASKSIPVRLLVLGAGSLMNILLPLVLLAVAYMIPHIEGAADIMNDEGELLVVEIAADSPADQAGLEVNDIIVNANGTPISNISDYSEIVASNLGNAISVEVKHEDNTTETVTMTPRTESPEGEGATGVAVTTIIRKSYPVWEAIPQGANAYWNLLTLYTDGIVGMISGSVPVDVTGPVGIAQVTGEVVKTGFANLLIFAAFISINLGIINIFPIPAMDGGRIVFVLLEWIRRGKRVSPKTEGMVHAIGFVVLIILFLVIAYKDVLRIISGEGFGF